MSNEITSKTTRSTPSTTSVALNAMTLGAHPASTSYKTELTVGGKTYEGTGKTASESQANANKRAGIK